MRKIHRLELPSPLASSLYIFDLVSQNHQPPVNPIGLPWIPGELPTRFGPNFSVGGRPSRGFILDEIGTFRHRKFRNCSCFPLHTFDIRNYWRIRSKEVQSCNNADLEIKSDWNSVIIGGLISLKIVNQIWFADHDAGHALRILLLISSSESATNLMGRPLVDTL